MKGIVFTEFLEMLEDQHSPEFVDVLLDSVELASQGAYTSVGTYDHAELVVLVERLSELTGQPVPALVHAFGQHLLGQFSVKFPQFFPAHGSTFDFLEHVDSHIHTEVRKLYPDAQLPRFQVRRHSKDCLEMVYQSERPFADLAAGLIEGVANFYGQSIRVDREPLPQGARFMLHLLA